MSVDGFTRGSVMRWRSRLTFSPDRAWKASPAHRRRAFPVACYLGYALNQLELPVRLLDGLGGMLHEFSRTIGRGFRGLAQLIESM